MNQPNPSSPERGSMLVIVLAAVVVVAAFAFALMQNAGHDHRRTSALERGVRAVYLAEAGANHAIADLAVLGAGSVGSQTSPVAFGGGGYWFDIVDNGDGSFTVTSFGQTGEQIRAMEVILAPEEVPLFTKALFGDLDLGATGNVFTDSYDSDLGSYASQATNVDAVTGRTYAKSEGALGSNANITLNGGVIILGDATPGPGGSVFVNGGASYVAGSTAPSLTTTPMPAIEFNPSGASTGDFSSSADVTFTAGEYHYTDFTAKSQAVFTFEGDVILYVDADLSVTAQAQLVVSPGATVTIYHQGDNISLTGGGVVNQTQLPVNFKVFSTAEDVKFGGNSSFYGAVYAPNGTIDPGGTTDIHGSFVGREIMINGTADFHYDESLGKAPDSMTTLRPVSWRRVSVAGLLAGASATTTVTNP
jgi:Putative Ice-binding-like adhesive domain